LVAFGVVLRLLTARTAWAQPDGDNGLTMMMAFRASHGHLNLLWWGSNYGGAPLSWIQAPLVRVFGVRPSLFATFHFALVLLGAWFVRCMGRRVMSRSAAAVAGGVVVFFPALWVYWGSRGYLFWVPSIVVALACDLLALRWFESPSRARLVGCGLCAGVG